ncbi:MAG TPA: hypothetical protein VG146_04275 [Verrucomicrobiae bacterium]|nr:hypothetical protein [Verrucomicrobiae bacterium]
MINTSEQFRPKRESYENARYPLEVQPHRSYRNWDKALREGRGERLAAELNEDYPDIDHDAVVPEPMPTEAADAKSQKI